jgi:hypothetical protein
MLCGTCFQMLRGQSHRQWKGTYDVHFEHHRNLSDLKKSAEEANCGICKPVYEQLQSKLQNVTNLTTSSLSEPYNKADSEGYTITASLSVVPTNSASSEVKQRQLYRLDSKIKHNEALISKRTFVLRTIGEHRRLHGTRRPLIKLRL